jgi:hypothetical protein
MNDSLAPKLRSRSATVGSFLVALSYAIAGLAAYAILSDGPDVHTRAGRHLLAGALAVATLSVVEILIALFPLRRGAVWAFWAALLPLVSLVIPIMLVDAIYVAREHRLATVAPFISGLVLAAVGLFLATRRTPK